MSTAPLPNYLTANRKRMRFSQEEVAFLLGLEGGTTISRYERFEREPCLRAALAFEVIFQRSASELFAGLYQQVEQEVTERMKHLANRKQ